MRLSCIAAVLALGCGRIDFDPFEEQPPVVDGDGDGVADDADNCSGLANAEQDNEDGDALGDLCDPCPPISEPDAGADRDGDGVGDSCDPFPDQNGDRIELFEGFARPPAQLALVGTWTFANGAATVTSSLNELAGATIASMSPGETVSTRVTIDEMFGDLVARPVGVVHEFNAPMLEGIVCVFGINPSNDEVYAIADNASTGAFVLVPTIATVGTSSTFSSRRSGPDYACNAQRLTMPMQATSNLSSNPNRVGLFARSASATFDWLMVVSSPR